MDILQCHPTLKDVLSKIPENAVLWERFLAELNKIMDCASGMIQVTDLVDESNSHCLYLYHVPSTQQAHYGYKFNKLDRFSYRVAKNSCAVYCSQTADEFCSDDEMETGFMIPYSHPYCYGLSIPYSCRYAWCLYLNRSKPFTGEERQRNESLLQALIPELKKTLHKEKWRHICSQLISFTGEHASGYLMVDRTLKILFSEPVFSMMVADLRGIEMSDNRLTIADKALESRLLTAILAGKHCQALSLPDENSTWLITIIPVSALNNLYAWEFDKEGIILTFTNGAEKNAAIARLMALHHLTRCEALCALHFISSPSITDIADNSCRSIETVRNHLKKIMHKLDVHNQAALMKKLLAVVSL